jgi:hypothetical protein
VPAVRALAGRRCAAVHKRPVAVGSSVD